VMSDAIRLVYYDNYISVDRPTLRRLAKDKEIDVLLAQQGLATYTLIPRNREVRESLPACFNKFIAIRRNGRSIFDRWAGGFTVQRSPEKAVEIGVHVLGVLESLHKTGLVFGGQFIHSLVVTAGGKYVLKNMHETGRMLTLSADGKEFVRSSSCNYSERPYRLAPGEIRGFCATRYDDMYRLAEALFKIAGTSLDFSTVWDSDILLRNKAGWELKPELMDRGSVHQPPSARETNLMAVLNAFHKEMYDHSNDLDLAMPNYQAWIREFSNALKP
jgi:hypothetical protein